MKKSGKNTISAELPRELLHPRFWGTWLAVGFYRVLSLLPMKARHALARPLARLAWKQNAKRRGIVLKNLELCFPELSIAEREALGQKHFSVMARSLLDLGQVWFASDNRLLEIMALEGWENVKQAREAGKNIIFNVAHGAALDFGAAAVGHRESSMGPYNAAKNPIVDWYIAKGRRRFGNRVFERNDGMMAYTRTLKRGTTLYTLSDEDHGPEVSVFAPFFAEPKATLPMIGRLAKVANAAVLPLMTYYDAKTQCYVTRISPAIADFPVSDPIENATRMNQSLEALIEVAPEEYMWTLRLFKTRPDGGRVYDY